MLAKIQIDFSKKITTTTSKKNCMPAKIFDIYLNSLFRTWQVWAQNLE